MTAVPRPLYIEQGATFTTGFNWHRESDPPTFPATAGAAYDLTGCVVRMQLRKNQQSPIILAASSDGENPAITLGGVTGRIDIKLTDEMTDQVTTKSAQYDLEVQMANGDVHRLLEGSVTISPNITQVELDPVLSP